MQNELTPARRELAELLDARTTASAELANLTARAQRLARAKEAIAPLESELISLDASASAAALAWSELDDGSPAPVADAKRRAKVEAALLTARAAARAADSATVGLQPQVEKVGAHLRALEIHIQQAAANIVVEESMALLFPEVKAAIAAVEAVRGRVVAARKWMVSLTDRPEGQAAAPFTLNFQAFDREFNLASSRPELVADPAEWMSLASRLVGDHTATLEEAAS
jgi:hypothetical protein